MLSFGDDQRCLRSCRHPGSFQACRILCAGEKKGRHPGFLPTAFISRLLLSDKNSRPFQFIKFAKESVMFLLIGDEIGKDIPRDKELTVVQGFIGKFK